MQIAEITGRTVRLSKSSITVVDDSGKTAGVVRDVTRWDTLPPAKQFQFSKILRETGIWEAGLVDYVIVVGGLLYYIIDEKYEQNFQKYFAGRGFETDEKKHDQRLAIIRNIESRSDITAIRCFIIKK